MPNEFDLIKHFFKQKQCFNPEFITLGSGDDCALLNLPQGYELALSIDTLVSGVHFFQDENPFNIAYKAVMSSASDLAAMGAKPVAITMALTLPEANNNWLSEFSQGLFAALESCHIDLIGGDLSRGPLSITAQVHGLVPNNRALIRSRLQPGDQLYVSGFLGGAAFALSCLQGKYQLNNTQRQGFNYKQALNALLKPQARLVLGQILQDYANACIDLSDGLISDLGHMAKASNYRLQVNLDHIPYHPALSDADLNLNLNEMQKWRYALGGGDDYELCFSVPKIKQKALLEVLSDSNHKIYPIGTVLSDNLQKGQPLIDFCTQGQLVDLTDLDGFKHF